MRRDLCSGWTVDYGSGPQPIQIPHAWRQDVPVEWEGPAWYRRQVEAEQGPAWLVFHGVSCSARVSVDGVLAAEHLGIWDAFLVPLPGAGSFEIAVEVIKNGGPTIPVKSVASGFLPYVFHTFGGIFRPVELAMGEMPDLEPLPPERLWSGRSPNDPRFDGETERWSGVMVRASSPGKKGRAVFSRDPHEVERLCQGVLTWGWEPELGHPHLTGDEMVRQISLAKEMGFDLIKFCLWLPPHDWLEEMARQNLHAWIELPVWMPDSNSLPRIGEEILRIARQYRRHPNILAWTVGCELAEETPPQWRKQMAHDILWATGSQLVLDNSGGSEMYGGHPEEVGRFRDYHPYCDLPLWGPVLRQLAQDPGDKPRLLGETNDCDCFRPLAKLADDAPYWASSDSRLNAQGVRWQYDLPQVLEEWRQGGGRKIWLEPREVELQARSRERALFIRRRASASLRSVGSLTRHRRSAFAGWVITGWRDTPISSAGMLDDDGQPRFSPAEMRRTLNGAFILPGRRPPWLHGGNRPGLEDPEVRWCGPNRVWMGPFERRHCAKEYVRINGRYEWILDQFVELIVEIQPAENPFEFTRDEPEELSIFGVAPPGPEDRFTIIDRTGDGLAPTFEPGLPVVFGGGPMQAGLGFPDREGLIRRPFWRESVPWFEPEIRHLDDDRIWAPISPDGALDPAWLDGELGEGWSALAWRVDTRTYERLPLIARCSDRRRIAAAARPWGGLGDQPLGLKNNPAGLHMIRELADVLSSARP